MRCAYLLVVVNLHWMMVGHVFEQSQIELGPLALTVSARAAAFASAIDFCFVIMALLSPLVHTFVHFYNLGVLRLSFHQIHIHRSMSVSGCVFAVIHITLHVVAWCINPATQVEGKDIYQLNSVAFITGLVLVITLVGAGISGFNLKVNLYSPKSAALHLPFSLLFFVTLFGHGFEKVLGAPLGDYMVVGMFAICAGSFIIFVFAVPMSRKEVDFKRSVWGDVIREKEDHFMLVAVKYGSSSSIPPGSFFNIYASYGTSLSYVHAHPFPVFSTKNGSLVFLIQCRQAQREEHTSFTQQLLVVRYCLYFYFLSSNCSFLGLTFCTYKDLFRVQPIPLSNHWAF